MHAPPPAGFAIPTSRPDNPYVMAQGGNSPLLPYVWVVAVWYGSWRLTGPQVSMMVARAVWALWKP